MPMEFIGVLHRQTAVHCPASLHQREQEMICPLLGCIFSTPRNARMMRRALNTPAAKKSITISGGTATSQNLCRPELLLKQGNQAR
jgi:hypothetical protein